MADQSYGLCQQKKSQAKGKSQSRDVLDLLKVPAAVRAAFSVRNGERVGEGVAIVVSQSESQVRKQHYRGSPRISGKVLCLRSSWSAYSPSAQLWSRTVLKLLLLGWPGAKDGLGGC